MTRHDKYFFGAILASLLVCSALFFDRNVEGSFGVETDFYAYYAPNAKEIAELRGFPIDDYRGPGYSSLLALTKTVSGLSYFDAAVLLNFICLVLTFFSIRSIANTLNIRSALPYWLFGLTPAIIIYTVKAGPDIVFMMVCSTFFALLISGRMVTAGYALAGALMIRYNAAALLLLPIMMKSWRTLVAPAVALLAWGTYTWHKTGTFLHNKNYLNLETLKYDNADKIWNDGAVPSGFLEAIFDIKTIFALLDNYGNVVQESLLIMTFPIVLMCLWNLRSEKMAIVYLLCVMIPCLAALPVDRYYLSVIPVLCLGFFYEVPLHTADSV